MVSPFRQPRFYAMIGFVLTAIFEALMFMHPDAHAPWFIYIVGPPLMAAVSYSVAYFVLNDREEPPGRDREDPQGE